MEKICEQILKSKSSVNRLRELAPKEPGVYAIFLNQGIKLPHGIVQGEQGCIYVGKAESGIRKRILQEHLKTGNSGRSAFRRRLGAVLKDELKLTAIPRDEKFGKKHRLFKFEEAGEVALSKWITENVSFGWCIINEEREIKQSEKNLAFRLKPCLPDEPDWGNPYKTKIESLYASCVSEGGEKYESIYCPSKNF